MKIYGSVLTGREFGKDTMEKIDYPVTLDFTGVNSLGSSFTDEVLLPIAKKKNDKVVVANVKPPVWACIQDVAKDGDIEVAIEKSL